MKNKLILLSVCLILLLLLCACKCKHESFSAASCTEPSLCHDCGEVLSPALGHTEATDAAVEPTCTETGLTEGTHCAVCNMVFTAQQSIKALGHSWEAATCTEPKTCSICNTTSGDALGHKYSSKITKEASCSQDGQEVFTCSRCKDSYDQVISMPTYAANEIYERSKASVGEIITYNKKGKEESLGTCFVYSKDGKFITNYHVIDGAYSAKITINDRTYTVQKVLAYDKTIDLAILKVSGTFTPLEICSKTHTVGKAVYAIGSSRGLTLTFSQGIITHSNREMDNVNYVQHDAAISNGNSGGPLINEFGEVIGVNTLTIKDSQNLNFAISMAEVDNLVQGTPLTFAEFYEKECDVFTKLKNYILEEGSYSYTYEEYYIYSGYRYSSDYSSKYSRYIYYDPDTETISFYLFINSSDYQVWITIDEDVDGSYSWGYFDDYDERMSGTLYANTFTSNTLVGYSYTNVYSSSLKSSIRELASSMIKHLCSYMDDDLEDIGLSAEDLGFIYY